MLNNNGNGSSMAAAVPAIIIKAHKQGKSKRNKRSGRNIITGNFLVEA